MKENIGNTIKTIANICYIIGAIASIIIGLVLATEIGGFFILISILLPLVLLVPYYLMFGFGEVIIKLYEIEENTRPQRPNREKAHTTNSKTSSKHQKTHPNSVSKSDLNSANESAEESFEDLDEEYYSDIDDEDSLPQKKCPDCGNRHDFDYPKCPNCGHKYED